MDWRRAIAICMSSVFVSFVNAHQDSSKATPHKHTYTDSHKQRETSRLIAHAVQAASVKPCNPQKAALPLQCLVLRRWPLFRSSSSWTATKHWTTNIVPPPLLCCKSRPPRSTCLECSPSRDVSVHSLGVNILVGHRGQGWQHAIKAPLKTAAISKRSWSTCSWPGIAQFLQILWTLLAFFLLALPKNQKKQNPFIPFTSRNRAPAYTLAMSRAMTFA